MKLSIRHRLKLGSNANYVRLGFDLSSTLKAQNGLRLDNFRLVPPLTGSARKVSHLVRAKSSG